MNDNTINAMRQIVQEYARKHPGQYHLIHALWLTLEAQMRETPLDSRADAIAMWRVYLHGKSESPKGGQYKKISAIKFVRMILGIGLKEAKSLVESSDDGGKLVVSNTVRETAESIAEQFRSYGFDARVVATTLDFNNHDSAIFAYSDRCPYCQREIAHNVVDHHRMLDALL